jgi:hypothetical protein
VRKVATSLGGTVLSFNLLRTKKNSASILTANCLGAFLAQDGFRIKLTAHFSRETMFGQLLRNLFDDGFPFQSDKL